MIVLLTGTDFMRVIPGIIDATFDRSKSTATIQKYNLNGKTTSTEIVDKVNRMELKDDNGAISIADSRYSMKDTSELKASTGVSPIVRPTATIVRPATTEPELTEMGDA